MKLTLLHYLIYAQSSKIYVVQYADFIKVLNLGFITR